MFWFLIDSTIQFSVWMPGAASYKTKRPHLNALVNQQGGIAATGTTDIWRVGPAGSELQTIGPLTFYFFDAGGVILGKTDCMVTAALPGELAQGERDAIATALLELADGVENGITVRTALKLLDAFVAGKVNGSALTWQFRDPGDTVDRIDYSLTGDGGRFAVTINPS